MMQKLTKYCVLFCWSMAVFSRYALADSTSPIASWPAQASVVSDITFSPDARKIATFGDEGSAKLWDVATKKLIGGLDEIINGQNFVRFSPDGKTLYALDRDDSLARLNTDDGKRFASLPLKTSGGSTTAFDISPNGKQIAVVGRGSLRILSANDGSAQQKWVVHELYGINAVAFSPDGKFISTAGTDHKVNIVQVTDGKIVFSFDTHLNGKRIAYAQDGKHLYVTNSDGSLQMLEIANSKVSDLGKSSLSVLDVAPSLDGKLLYAATGGHGPIKLTLGSAEPDKSAFSTDKLIKTVTISFDGTVLAGGGQDGSVQIWKTKK